MNELGKILIFIGAALVVIGILVSTGFGKGWFGRLPGDISYSKGNFSFYFPIVTSLVVSAVLTIILWVLRK